VKSSKLPIKKKLLTFYRDTLEEGPMKMLRLTLFWAVLVIPNASPMVLAAGTQAELAQADSCQASCKANADACRAQCSDPEEQQQCIVACGRSECAGNCKRYEEACKKHCPGAS